MIFKRDKMPDLYGGVVLMFPKSVLFSQITSLFGKDVKIRVYEGMSEMTYLTYTKVKKIYSWEVNDLLTALFQQCDFDLLLLAQKQLGAKILIDIAFYHHHKYPALIFDGANMEIIHMLKADISIDPY